ncbi:MAG TPA: CpsD/CapB family tyrosine-protein kinase [Polyangiaceae bacterium]|nr:CpsD/CapB family tyrosine-protein kinase [Polyangiaceae bacterium]
MSQLEIVKNRIIDVVPARIEQATAPQAITKFAWTTLPVTVIEEVQLPDPPDRRLVALRAPDSPYAHSYRLLRHRLLAQGDPRIIAVTSAAAGDGKTTCAANLALVLSEETLSRVLLVEGNLVRPGLPDLFGFDPADSFMTKLLRSEDATPPHAVASVSRIRLQLAAVHPELARGKRIDRALLAEAVRELRGSYDYVVFDAAAVSDGADVNSICACCDATLLVARSGRSRKRQILSAVEQLQPAVVAGLVLIDT